MSAKEPREESGERSKSNAVAPTSFEQEISELEQIVDALEHESLSLEESLARFERGMQLSKQLEARLRAAEARVRKWSAADAAAAAASNTEPSAPRPPAESERSDGSDGQLF